MSDYSELYFSNGRTPARQGELDGSSSPYLLSRYHVPLFWLALFESEDIVDDGEGWPLLVKARTAAVALLNSRQVLLQRRFPLLRPQWHEQFDRFLRTTPFEYVHADTSQIGAMTGSAQQWREELEMILRGLFTETPSATRLSSFLGALNYKWAPNPGWEIFQMRLGSAFDRDKGQRPWPYCGESGTDDSMPWEG